MLLLTLEWPLIYSLLYCSPLCFFFLPTASVRERKEREKKRGAAAADREEARRKNSKDDESCGNERATPFFSVLAIFFSLSSTFFLFFNAGATFFFFPLRPFFSLFYGTTERHVQPPLHYAMRSISYPR